MFSRIREHLGTAGLVVAIVALSAALAGGAYAASGGLSGKQKKEVEKIAKKLAGKPGAPGATGPAGAPGAKGEQGAVGSPGANGKSVLTGTPSAGECSEGGATVEVEGNPASKQKICNGEEGPQGPAGPSCNAGGECLLPPGATEAGTWSFGGTTSTFPFADISFNLRLTAAPEFKWVSVADSSTPGAVSGCPGTVADPKAEAGKVCLYAKELPGTSIEFPEQSLVSSIGVVFSFERASVGAEAYGVGTWAVKR